MLTLQQAFELTFHGKYSFDDFLHVDVVSQTKKIQLTDSHKHHRIIYQPSQTVKDYLRFLNKFVFSYARTFDSVVFSYKRESSAFHAIKQHAGHHCFFKTDIANFFESINRSEVVRLIDVKLDNAPLIDLFEYSQRIETMVLMDTSSLPIGFPTSPLISNSVLYELDRFFADWSQKNQVTYTRYSDDLIFSAENDGSIKQLPDLLSEWLNNHYESHFKLNQKKTFFTHSGQKVKLLGLVLLPNGHITISRQIKDKIESLMYSYRQDRQVFSELLSEYFSGSGHGLMAFLNYIQRVDKHYIEKLRRKYGNYTVDLFLHNGGRL